MGATFRGRPFGHLPISQRYDAPLPAATCLHTCDPRYRHDSGAPAWYRLRQSAVIPLAIIRTQEP